MYIYVDLFICLYIFVVKFSILYVNCVFWRKKEQKNYFLHTREYEFVIGHLHNFVLSNLFLTKNYMPMILYICLFQFWGKKRKKLCGFKFLGHMCLLLYQKKIS